MQSRQSARSTSHEGGPDATSTNAAKSPLVPGSLPSTDTNTNTSPERAPSVEAISSKTVSENAEDPSQDHAPEEQTVVAALCHGDASVVQTTEVTS